MERIELHGGVAAESHTGFLWRPLREIDGEAIYKVTANLRVI